MARRRLDLPRAGPAVATAPPQIRAVVFDLDGVIRHWRASVAEAAEDAAGLPRGALESIAYDVPEFIATQDGSATVREWGDAIRRELVARFGPGADAAADPFLDDAGELDLEMVDVVAAVRRQLPVALLSNATDELRDHLARHELTAAFDYVFSSAELRMAKPDPAIFRHVAAEMGLQTAECFFTDDRPENVEGARAAGMRAEVFTGKGELLDHLRALGVDPPGRTDA
ncbi:MAG: HAD family phosphatase [Frankia sp.]|nr:HAD family phosphatase [Frankia sp.]